MRAPSVVFSIALLAVNLFAQDSWSALSRLSTGQVIEVATTRHELHQGAFVSVSEDSITVATKARQFAVPRAEVARVRLRPARRLAYTLVGVGIGAGAGAGLGSAVADRFANESGGDFAGLRPAIIAATCAVGALIGLLVGSVLGNRGPVVYRAK